MTAAHEAPEEDLLEALLEEPASDEAAVARRLGLDTSAVAGVLAAAGEHGHIERGAAGNVRLSAEGRKAARRVARRRRTLACFFEEIGMAKDAADREARTLKREVSDEAIEKLADHLHCPGPNERPCEGNAEGTPLIDYEEGARVCITSVCPCGRYRRLMDMGVVPGEEVVIKRRLSSRAVVIEVKGCEVGLSPECGVAVLAAPCP